MDSQAICLELYSSEYGNSPLKVQPQGKQDFAPEFVDTWKASCLLISNNLTPQKPATVASKKCYFLWFCITEIHPRTQVQQGCYGLGVGLVLQTLKLEGVQGRWVGVLDHGKPSPNVDLSGW